VLLALSERENGNDEESKGRTVNAAFLEQCAAFALWERHFSPSGLIETCSCLNRISADQLVPAIFSMTDFTW